MIVQTNQGFQVKSEAGKPLSKPDLRRDEALRRLQQIEWFKKQKR